MAAGRTRETLIALRATRAAHRIATEVALSQIKELQTRSCPKCGKGFTPEAGTPEGVVLCPGCRAVRPRLSPQAARLVRFVEMMCEELQIPLAPVRSAPFAGALEARGLHPDACYYVRNIAAATEAGPVFDPAVHPPPDLDVSGWPVWADSPLLLLRVPELWRFDGRHFQVHVLTDKGEYERRTTSLAFPFLPIPDLEQLIAHLHDRDEPNMMDGFRQWIRALRRERSVEVVDAEEAPVPPAAAGPDGKDVINE